MSGNPALLSGMHHASEEAKDSFAGGVFDADVDFKSGFAFFVCVCSGFRLDTPIFTHGMER